mgnify:CR=1 FL=1
MTAKAKDVTAPLPASKQRLRVWIRMLRATRRVEAALRERLRAEFGETLPRFDVLAALDKSETGISLTQLSRMLMVSNGNVTGLIERLVNEGYVTRLAVAGDRRTTLVRLTGAGTRHFQTMARAHEAWVAELLSMLDDAEAAHLIEIFRTFPKLTATPETSS